MSLGIVIKGPEGLVLAAESRVTLTASMPAGPVSVNFDNATKLLSFSEPYSSIGVVTYGLAALGQEAPRTAHSFIPEFEASLPAERCSVEKFAQHLSDFFSRRWEQAGMPTTEYSGPALNFLVAGFDSDDAYGKVFEVALPHLPVPAERNPSPEFGVTWGGQLEVLNRLLYGFDPALLRITIDTLSLNQEQATAVAVAYQQLQLPIPVQIMALQDCVDLAIFAIRTTMAAQRLTIGIRGVGGHIDVAIITRRERLQFVQRKQIIGEFGAAVSLPKHRNERESYEEPPR